MTENLHEIVLGVLTGALTAALGWFGRAFLWRRALRRRQRFLGLPDNAPCLLVVGRDPATEERAVARSDVFALLELSALIKDCRARADVVPHDEVRQGFGEQSEFCIGGPASNQRTAAHLRSLLPGVTVHTGPEPGPERGALTVGGEHYRMEPGTVEYVLLARLTGAQEQGERPVFVVCGQRGVANQAATRYLSRRHLRLSRRHGSNGTFCLLLKVTNSRAYGPDMVELVADVTRAATRPAPAPAAGSPASSAA